MFGVLFTNVLMLSGLAALGIPVLIHLLLKRRRKKVAFSTIRFFQQQDEQSSRRRKLRNWFLLALRLLIVALLVLAFSRPYSHQNQSAGAGRKQRRVVFVLDRSASMFASGTDGQRWAAAKAQIQKALSDFEPEDAVALIDCGARANVLSGFAPPANAAEMLRQLTPLYGTSSLVPGLQQAVRLLSGSPANSQPTIYLVTDLQKNACQGLAGCPIPQQIDFKLLAVGDASSPNLAISALETQGRDGARPHVTVASFSDEDTSAAVELAADGQVFASQGLALKSGASTNIDILFPALKPGWHDLTATLHARDALEADNHRYASFFVPEPARVLMVEPRPGSHVFEQACFFLTSALDPSKGTTNPVPSSFKLTDLTPDRLADALRAGRNQLPWNVVMIPGLKEMPEGVGKSLLAFVQGGGGLVLFLDEGMSANRFNSELHELLPARLGNFDQSRDITSPWRLALYDTNSPVFAAFRLPNSGDLRIPEFTKRFSMEVTPDASRLAFFDDGQPLVVARALGRGSVLLVNTSSDTSWTDWPKHKTFVPFIHGLAKYAAQNTVQDRPEETSVEAGDDFELTTGLSGKAGQFTLRTPDAKELKITADAQGRLRDADLGRPGSYSLRDAAGHEIRRLSVNLPAQESNLESLRHNDFLQQLTRVQEKPKETLAAGLFGLHNYEHEFWTVLLLAALVLVLVEPFIANRTSV